MELQLSKIRHFIETLQVVKSVTLLFTENPIRLNRWIVFLGTVSRLPAVLRALMSRKEKLQSGDFSLSITSIVIKYFFCVSMTIYEFTRTRRNFHCGINDIGYIYNQTTVYWTNLTYTAAHLLPRVEWGSFLNHIWNRLSFFVNFRNKFNFLVFRLSITILLA